MTMPQTFNVGSRSLFVSVTAWWFIVFGIAATAVSVIQGAATAALLPGFNLSLDVKPLHGLVQVLAAHLPWVAGAALALSIGTLVAAVGAPLPQEAAGVFGGFATAARAAAVTLSVATCLLLGWIIARLNTQAVRQEFA
jgi:hypothetical protein